MMTRASGNEDGFSYESFLSLRRKKGSKGIGGRQVKK